MEHEVIQAEQHVQQFQTAATYYFELGLKHVASYGNDSSLTSLLTSYLTMFKSEFPRFNEQIEYLKDKCGLMSADEAQKCKDDSISYCPFKHAAISHSRTPSCALALFNSDATQVKNYRKQIITKTSNSPVI